LLRSLQEIQPDFVEEAKASAGLWSQGKKKKTKKKTSTSKVVTFSVVGVRTPERQEFIFSSLKPDRP
jgi:hypothetical protein